MEVIKLIWSKVLGWSGWLFVVATTGNLFYLTWISVFPDGVVRLEMVVLVRVVGLMLAAAGWWKMRQQFEVKSSDGWWWLLPAWLIFLARFPIVYPASDDLYLHAVVGDYANRLWNGDWFKPMSFGTYGYPLPQMIYTPFLYLVGYRLTILLVSSWLWLWYTSICLRFRELVTGREKKWLLSLVFVYMFFVPHLTATHGTLMIDFMALVFVLEAAYQILKNEEKTLGLVLGIGAMLLKQSTGIFVLPFLAYMALRCWRKINWWWVAVSGGVLGLFFVRLYLETGNPIIGFFNSYFKSSLYETFSLSGVSGGFGPKNNWVELLGWPIFGQFTDHYGEGWVSWPEKIWFSLAVAGPYLVTIIMLVKRRWDYLPFFLGYLLWSKLFGYARYHVPLSLLTLTYFLISEPIRLRLGQVKTYLVGGATVLGCLLAWQTDFAWRPTPYARVYGGTMTSLDYYLSTYRTGISLTGEDTMPKMRDFYADEFAGYDAVMPTYRGWGVYYAYLGYLNGLRVVEGIDRVSYQQIVADSRVSQRIKRNLDWTGLKTIMLVVDKSKQEIISEHMDRLEISRDYDCSKLKTDAKSFFFQTSDYFSSLIRYKCVRKI